MEQIPKCGEHQGICVNFATMRQEVDTMESRLEAVEQKVYSPAVVVAILGLVGTFAATAGGILSTILIIAAKAHGWG